MFGISAKGEHIPPFGHAPTVFRGIGEESRIDNEVDGPR
jgi:hypothetical protein